MLLISRGGPIEENTDGIFVSLAMARPDVYQIGIVFFVFEYEGYASRFDVRITDHLYYPHLTQMY